MAEMAVCLMLFAQSVFGVVCVYVCVCMNASRTHKQMIILDDFQYAIVGAFKVVCIFMSQTILLLKQ